MTRAAGDNRHNASGLPDYLTIPPNSSSWGVFQRGQDYFKASKVLDFRQLPGKLVARVQGSLDFYKVEIVEISENEDELQIECNCLYDGAVCKHSVAVLLHYLTHSQLDNSVETTVGSNAVMRQTLESLTTPALINLILELAR